MNSSLQAEKKMENKIRKVATIGQDYQVYDYLGKKIFFNFVI